MTNIEGIWMLFLLLALLAICLAVTALLILDRLGWTRWTDHGEWADRLAEWGSVAGVALSILSSAVAVVLVTPMGIVAHVTAMNQMLLVMLVGFTLPIVVAGFIRPGKRGGTPRTVTQ